ncbi:MAG: acyl-CoA dehydrogenase [Pseudomonadota bacterium]
MANSYVDERDQEFVLFEQYEIQKFKDSKYYAEFDRETAGMILEEAEKLAVEILAPANAKGDEEGCRLEDGVVYAPESFKEPWRLLNEGEWRRISDNPEIGGQGQPLCVGLAAAEFFDAANSAFMTYSVLAHGAAMLIADFGTDAQKEKYFEKVMSGQWGGTMVLTEPGAGSDVGALKTKAVRNPDGTFSISGSKIFITAGDHDLTENIIHPVLARIEGAPEGTRGISIFLVPKIRVNDDDSLGEPNDVHTGVVEHKMGIKGSATCQLNFGEEGKCVGELLGEENQGMKIMFRMMNEARLNVGRQGASNASAAFRHALAYAKDRLQGADLKAPKAGQAPIIRHPDVRRMLLGMKAVTEGLRALNLYAAYCIDRERMAESEEDKRRWAGQVALLTPVCKAYSTDQGFRVCETALQVYGGYGYIHEYPVEQFLRDQKITSIYEGANGIQALDLVGRKLGLDGGRAFMDHLGAINKFLEANRDHPSLGKPLELLEKARNALAETTMFFAQAGQADFLTPILFATPYMELFGDVTLGWLLLWQAVIAEKKLAEISKEKGLVGAELAASGKDAAFYAGKTASAQYFAASVLGLSPAKAAIIKQADRTALEIAEESF